MSGSCPIFTCQTSGISNRQNRKKLFERLFWLPIGWITDAPPPLSLLIRPREPPRDRKGGSGGGPEGSKSLKMFVHADVFLAPQYFLPISPFFVQRLIVRLSGVRTICAWWRCTTWRRCCGRTFSGCGGTCRRWPSSSACPLHKSSSSACQSDTILSDCPWQLSTTNWTLQTFALKTWGATAPRSVAVIWGTWNDELCH